MYLIVNYIIVSNARVYEPLRCKSALWTSYHKITKRADFCNPAASNGLYTLL
jgi:hypothetical protein